MSNSKDEQQISEIEQVIDSGGDDEQRNMVFEISDEEQQITFIAWILGVSEDEFNKGKEFLVGHNTSFRILWKLLSQLKLYTAVVEDHYVDRIYRDSYYFYYSGKHFNYNRFCKRISFFEGSLEDGFYECSCETLEKRFMGTVVIRPLADRAIGRTLLNPKYFLLGRNCRIRLAKYGVSLFAPE